MENPLDWNPKDAMDMALAAAHVSEPLVDLGDGRQRMLVPEGLRLEDVTDPERLPSEIKQRVTFNDRMSLEAYANRYKDDRSILIADIEAGTIAAHLNWHKDNEHDLAPQHASHVAALRLKDSEEFKRWAEIEDKMHPQEEFALFIEENVADVINPEPSVLLEICRDLEATVGVAFKSGVRLENGDRSFRYETDTQVKGEVAVPTEIELSIPLYEGESPVAIKAKFRFRPTAQGLLLGFRWHRVEYRRQATFREMAVTAADNTGLPVYFGKAA